MTRLLDWAEFLIAFAAIAVFSVLPSAILRPSPPPSLLAPSSEAVCRFTASPAAPRWVPRYDGCFTADGRVADCPANFGKLPDC